MQFPNAHKGISRIYTAEILMLIGVIPTVLAIFAGIVGIAAQNSPDGAGVAIGFAATAGIFAIVGGVLAIIALIMNITGVNLASKDEPTFKNALIWLIVGLVVSFISSALTSSNSGLADILKAIGNICSFLTTYYVITGIGVLADKLGNAEVKALGQKTLKLILYSYVVLIAAMLIAGILTLVGAGQAGATVAMILSLVATVMSIIVFVLYLRLLSKAKKMLAA